MEFLKWYSPIVVTWATLLNVPNAARSYVVLVFIPIAYFLWRNIHDSDISKQPMKFLAWWSAAWLIIEPVKSLFGVIGASDIYQAQNEIWGLVLMIPAIVYTILLLRVKR